MIRKTSARARWAALTSGALIAGGLVVAPAVVGMSTASAAPVDLSYTCSVVTPIGNIASHPTVHVDITAPASVTPGADVPIDITATITMTDLSFPVPVSSITGDWDFPLTFGGKTTVVNMPSSWSAPGTVVFPLSGKKTLTAPTAVGDAPITLGNITGHLSALGLDLEAPCTADAGPAAVGSVAVAEGDPDPDPDPDPVAVPVTGTVALSGTPKVGKTLTAVPGTADGATITYQWLANGSAISKATKPSLKLTKALKGKKVSVQATYGKDGFLETVQTSKAVKVKK